MSRSGARIALVCLLWSLLLVPSLGCDGDSDTDVAPDAGSETTPDAGGPDALVEDLELKAEDFTCIKDWDRVRMFRITNLLGHKEEALATANANTGGDYPVGTVIQLVWFEAMVKRRPGYSPASQDWEFIAFDVRNNKKAIVARGGDNSVLNEINKQPCLGCHAGAEEKWDLICEKGHGCDPLGVPDSLIEQFQAADPSCPPPQEPAP